MSSVDVLLPFFVHGDLDQLAIAISSVYAQDRPARQLFVLINGGTDADRKDCARRLSSCQRPDHPTELRLIVCAGRGIAAALNHGLHLSDADWLARLDADDLMLPERLKLTVDHLEHCLDHGLPVPDVLGTPVLVDGDSSSGQASRLQAKPITDPAIRRSLLWSNPFAHPSLLIRRRLLVAVGGYRPIKAAEDLDLWLRLARLPGVTFANLPTPLTRYTLAAGSLSHSSDSFLGSAVCRLRNLTNPLDLLLHLPKICLDLSRYLLIRLLGSRA